MAEVKDEQEMIAVTLSMFPKLPCEIRHLIWTMTLEPRIVVLKLDEYTTRQDQRLEGLFSRGFYTDTKNPPASAVCQESREIFLKHYELCFGSLWYPATTRFNFTFDTLYFVYDNCMPLLHIFFSILNERELTNIRYLALDRLSLELSTQDRLCHGTRFYKALERTIKSFKNLQELLIVDEIPRYKIFETGKWTFHSEWEENGPSMPRFWYSTPPQFEDLGELEGPSLKKTFIWVRQWDWAPLRPVWNWPHNLFFKPRTHKNGQASMSEDP